MSLVRPLLLWITLSAPLLCLLAIVLLACGGTEHAVFAVMRASRDAHPTLTTFLNGVSYWTNLLFYAWFAWLLLRALITGDRATRRFVLVYIAVQLLISLVTVRLLKMTIGRPRPGEDPFLHPFTTKPSYHSMPSGHTTEATTSTLSLSQRHGSMKGSFLLGIILALLGFSRIYLGWHHPSDVLCGWLLGSVAGVAVSLFAPKEHA